MLAPAKSLDLEVTPVFNRIWDAMNAKGPEGKPRYKYIILKGSSRSSKTWSLIDVLDIYARRQLNKRITVWRDSKVDCVDTVFNDIEKRLLSTGRWLQGNKFNATKTYLKYTTGTRIEAHGADDTVTIHGLTQDIAWLNEPYKISRDILDQIDQRTAEVILIDWNPRLAHWIEDLEKDEKAIVIHSTFRDNPFCPPAQRDKILSYQPVSRCYLVENKLLDPETAAVYDCAANPLGFPAARVIELQRCQHNQYKKSASNYNWSVYGMGEKAEKPNRIFSWQEIPLAEYLALDVPTYYYSDWGVVDPWAVGETKYYDGALYVRELNYSSENMIRERLSYTEHSQVGTDEDGIVTWLFKKLGIPFGADILCDSNRKMKILALRAAGWDYALGVSKREIVDGISLLSNLKVYYTSDSINIKHEQENYSRKLDRYGAVMEDPEDFDNHHIDGIRYTGIYLQDQGVIKIA